MPAKDTTENQVTADQAITKEIQGTVKKIVGDSKTEAPKTEDPKTDIPKKSFLKGLFSCCSRDVAQNVKASTDVSKAEQAKKAAQALKTKNETQVVEKPDNKDDEENVVTDLSKALDGKANKPAPEAPGL